MSWLSMDLNPEVESHIAKNTPWVVTPAKIKEIFGNSHKGYEKAVVAYSIRNQLRYSDSLVRTVLKNEPKYYEDMVAYSKEKLMLYPYHLSDRVVKGLRITPFQYYISILEKIMEQEKSYDSLPNFTAADCLRLLGIGRNQYIELMNQHRSSRKLFRRKPPKELLPSKPVDVSIEPWFMVQHGYVTEEDIAATKPDERKLIDNLIDNGGQSAGSLEFECVHGLYRKGLIYIDVPIEDDDYIVVPPLEGFVMNRVLGDYFETLLYKIFVSIDEHTTVGELATVLDIDVQLIKNAVSLYCRLGFAYKKNLEVDMNALSTSWKKYLSQIKNRPSYTAPDESLLVDELTSAIIEDDNFPSGSQSVQLKSTGQLERSKSSISIASDSSFFPTSQSTTSSTASKRVAFLYDSTLTAFLMMGNLSPGLKNHAVTMFEVGKMADESLDSFLLELDNVESSDGEGEAQRYFEHAKTLKKTILFLRNNPCMGSMAVDLLRCESLLNLDRNTCARLLKKNYELLVTMAPLSYEVKAISCEDLPHFGPVIPQINSIWFKLFLYSVTNSSPTSLLLSRGTLLSELPIELQDCDKYLITSWGHDGGVIPSANALFTLNDALAHSAVFVQAYGVTGESSVVVLPFPFASTTLKTDSKKSDDNIGMNSQVYSKWAKHPAIIRLSRVIDLEKNCGYITMMNVRGSTSAFENRIGSQSAHQVKNENETLASRLPDLQEEDLLDTIKTEDDDEDLSEEEYQLIVPSRIEPPKNGFKDEICAKLYQDELENELGDTYYKSESTPAFDPRRQKLESLRLDLKMSDSGSQSFKTDSGERLDVPLSSDKSDNENYCFNDWTILDCYFGVPLFDASVNQITCEQMLNNGLWEPHSLEQLVKSNANLAKQLTEFITTYQAPNIWNEDTPLPSKSFYCHNGRIKEFDP